MPSISTFPELLSSVPPYLNSPQPIVAMQRDGFTFGGEVSEALARRRPARPLDPAVLHRLEKSYGPPLTTRIHVGSFSAIPPAAPPTSGFSGVAAVRLDSINSVLAELWNVGTFPRQIDSSLVADVFDLPSLRQLCDHVPSGPDAAIGPLQIASAPVLSASANSGSIHVDIEFTLSVVGSQPASLKGILNIEIPLAFQQFAGSDAAMTPRIGLFPFNGGIASAVATIQVAVDSVIVPISSSAQSSLEDKFTTALRLALLFYSENGLLSIPAEYKLSEALPHTKLQIVQQGAVTVSRDNQSFCVLGVDLGQESQGDASFLLDANLPILPFDTHIELLESFGNDILNAAIQSGDLGALVSSHVNPDGLGPHIESTSGNFSFQNGNLSVTAGFVARDLCAGFDVNFTVQASGPPIIANGRMRIGAQYVYVSVSDWDEFVCYLVSLPAPLGWVLVTTLLVAVSGGHDTPDGSIDVSPTVAPLPGSAMDWSLEMKQATAIDGTLAFDGATTLTADPRIFVYLRIEEHGLGLLPPQPLANAQVVLFELDDPAPAGDDVTIPPTGTSIITSNPKFTTVISTSYQPSPDQTIMTLNTDENGDVVFMVNTSTSSVTPALNNIGGVITTSREQTDNYDGKLTSSTTTHTYVLEGEPDFGITITDSLGMTRATRRLIALNVVGNRVGSKDSPLVVEVDRVAVNAP
jgi:hypothetical protein